MTTSMSGEAHQFTKITEKWSNRRKKVSYQNFNNKIQRSNYDNSWRDIYLKKFENLRTKQV